MSGVGKPKPNLSLLADRLIARHLRTALPDTEVRNALVKDWRSAVSDIDLVERDMHCIAVVGAGASAPLLARGGELATELEARFGRHDVELKRLNLVYNLDPSQFETRLVALSRNPEGAAMVRKAISEKYKLQHPTLLGNELLAHLLKHRFLDAIISFNFDELLDRSLRDELSDREYEKIISERDCEGIQADPNMPDYVPLYVKLHGTASEPESLRFTPDAYYSIPERISSVVQELLHAEECVIVNVGSGLATFDLQHLFNLPRELKVFNLSYKAVDHLVSKKIDEVRRDESKANLKTRPEKGQKRPLKYAWLHECNAGQHHCDELLKQLADELKRKSAASARPDSGASYEAGGLLQFRSVRRHQTVARLLGADTIHQNWATIPGWTQAEWTEYTRLRTILELALAAAKARGLLSLVPLSEDRAACYYEDYRRVTKGQGESWSDLCTAAGLMESAEVPDQLVSAENLRFDKARPKTTEQHKQLIQKARRLEKELREETKRYEEMRASGSIPKKALKAQERTLVELTARLEQLTKLDLRLRQKQTAEFERALKDREQHRTDLRKKAERLEADLTEIKKRRKRTRKRRRRKELKRRIQRIKNKLKSVSTELQTVPERLALHHYDPEILAHHVLGHVRNPASFTDVRSLTKTLKEIQKHSEVELHMRDDRVCSKAFKQPATLPTSTSLKAYTQLMVSNLDPGDHVYVSSEKGDWLLYEPIRTLLAHAKLSVLLAFPDAAGKLRETYSRPKQLKLALIDPWRHNRHMTIVCQGNRPKRATYFARRLRNHAITAVYLENIADVDLLKQMYLERWEEAKSY